MQWTYTKRLQGEKAGLPQLFHGMAQVEEPAAFRYLISLLKLAAENSLCSTHPAND
jgi:hypothetical protein